MKLLFRPGGPKEYAAVGIRVGRFAPCLGYARRCHLPTLDDVGRSFSGWIYYNNGRRDFQARLWRIVVGMVVYPRKGAQP